MDDIAVMTTRITFGQGSSSARVADTRQQQITGAPITLITFIIRLPSDKSITFCESTRESPVPLPLTAFYASLFSSPGTKTFDRPKSYAMTKMRHPQRMTHLMYPLFPNETIRDESEGSSPLMTWPTRAFRVFSRIRRTLPLRPDS